MTDEQVITIGIAVIVPISALIYSNSRISDVKEVLRAEIATLRAEMNAGFTRVEGAIKAHELEHHR